MKSKLAKQYAQFFNARALHEIAEGADGAAKALVAEGEHSDARLFRYLAIYARAVGKEAA